VNIKNPIQFNIDESFIRTMADDVAVLNKGSSVPPNSLPIIKPDKKPVLSKKVELKSSNIKIPKRQSKYFFIIFGLIAILIVIGTGGFFYWWNYLKSVTPIVVTHFECQDNQCIIIEGDGDSKCQIDAECQPIIQELLIPDSLIPVNETKTIELIVGQENLLPGQLSLIIDEGQASSTINRILVKSVDQEEEKYIDLNTLILALNINIPENILSAITDDYTLFLYRQEEGNRLGIVIKMGESDTLVQDLNNWEDTMIDDLDQLFLIEDIPDTHSEEFQDKIYKDVYIRYMNFPMPILSLDYGIIAGNLVITTSREAMFNAIDTLLRVEEENNSF